MFYCCYSLTSVNLINFNTSQIQSFDKVFMNCFKLQFINMNNSKISNNSVVKSNPFRDIVNNAVICTEKSEDNLLYHYIKNSFGLNLDCSGNWENPRTKKIKESNIYVEKCNIFNISQIFF